MAKQRGRRLHVRTDDNKGVYIVNVMKNAVPGKSNSPTLVATIMLNINSQLTTANAQTKHATQHILGKNLRVIRTYQRLSPAQITLIADHWGGDYITPSTDGFKYNADVVAAEPYGSNYVAPVEPMATSDPLDVTATAISTYANTTGFVSSFELGKTTTK